MDLSIHKLLQAYAKRDLSPEQVVDYALTRSQEFKHHNIWINLLDKKQIQPYLDQLEKHSLEELPLYGIPFAIKDNIDLANINSTAACPDFSYTPQESAFVLKQLIKAGAIPIGKTNMDQFATGLVGTRSPEPWGACKNALNPEYISGGSSSGSAVAVALGIVSFSLGTDTAGSGRVPAALNNIVGLKPSRGLISTTGVIPACRSLDCVSIFTQSTDEANRVLECCIEADPDDAYSRQNPFNNSDLHYGMPSDSIVMAAPKREQLNFFQDQDAEQLYLSYTNKLKTLGITIIETDFSPFFNAARLLYDGPWVAERYVAVENLIENNPEAMLAEIQQIIGAAKNKKASDCFKALYELQNYKAQAQKILSQVDCLLTPTIGTTYTIEAVQKNPIELNSNLGYYTNFMNLLDCAALAVPAGFFSNGSGFGITLAAAAMSDRKLLSIGNWLSDKCGNQQHFTEQTTDSENSSRPVTIRNSVQIVVCGAHMKDLPLNWQLTQRGGCFIKAARTTANYRFYALPGGPPKRPALIRDEENGSAIEVEVWELPLAEFGSFVATIPAPLGIGKVELEDGCWLSGFIAEAHAAKGAEDITEIGAWRRYLSQK